jgi:hypothetical protein
LLSDHIFFFFGRTFTITRYEQLVAGAILCIIATAWAVQQFRRKRVIVVQRSAVSDQLLFELSRIADSLEIIANRPADQIIAAANQKDEESRTIPYSIFGRERPHN